MRGRAERLSSDGLNFRRCIMLKRCAVFLGIALMAGATVLVLPTKSDAAPRGWRGGYYGRGYYDGGYYGRRYYDGGYYGRGYDGGYYGRGYYPWGVGVSVGSAPWYYGAYPRGVYYDNMPIFYGAPAEGVTYSRSAYTPDARATTDDRAHLRIVVPAEKAEVWIQGEKSEQDRSTQNYMSPPLTMGKKYYYEVRARWTDANGKTVEASREIPIYAGQPMTVDFGRSEQKY
jgi:uncharacterized protein (TIGR03000 family)